MSEVRAKLKSRGKRFSKFSVVGLSNAAIDIGVLNLFCGWSRRAR
jgi:putative flippase GtrA